VLLLPQPLGPSRPGTTPGHRQIEHLSRIVRARRCGGLIPSNCNAVAALVVVLEIVLETVIGGEAARQQVSTLMAPWVRPATIGR